MPSPAEALPGRPTPIMTPGIHRSSARRSPAPGPRAPRPRSSASAASGAPRRTSGSSPASSRRPSAMPAATPPTRPTRRSAPAGPATPRSCWSPTTRRGLVRAAAQGLLGAPRPDPGHAPGQRPWAPSTARSSSSPTTSSGPPPRRRRRRLPGASCPPSGYGAITTEIATPRRPFYYAEDYHQQYLDKNPRGYCPNHATGVKLPDDFVVTPLQYVD